MSKNTEKPTKPSSADYPVDPAERMSQEARLKKAAAAGASASKSPISGLMLQTSPPPVADSQTSSPPQPVLPKAASSTETVPEPLADRNTPPLGYDEVVAELRKLSAWAELHRKITRWSLIFVAVFVPIAITVVILGERHLQSNLESNLTSSHTSDWYDVDHNIRQGDFEKAIALGEALILKTPQYPEAHHRLATAYLAAGNLEKAKEHYAEAFRLFPSEENEKALSAIEKRVKADSP